MWDFNREADLKAAADALLQGDLVAFPTETVYGLGADGFNGAACRKIFEAKERPADNPLILHIADIAQLAEIITELPPHGRRLIEAFWPGPLTLILPKAATVPPEVSSGLETVAVRMPSNPVAQELIRRVGRPLAAPSANLSGKPSPTTAAHVAQDLSERVAGIVDGGACEVGLESTIIDVTVQPPTILRPGGISREAIEAVIGPVAVSGDACDSDNSAPKAPGMKYRHYAPEAPVYMIQGQDRARYLQARVAMRPDRRVGLLLSSETLAQMHPLPDNVVPFDLGHQDDAYGAARRLFYGLRRLDGEGVVVIYTEGWSEGDIGTALMNRLYKLSRPITEEEWE